MSLTECIHIGLSETVKNINTIRNCTKGNCLQSYLFKSWKIRTSDKFVASTCEGHKNCVKCHFSENVHRTDPAQLRITWTNVRIVEQSRLLMLWSPVLSVISQWLTHRLQCKQVLLTWSRLLCVVLLLPSRISEIIKEVTKGCEEYRVTAPVTAEINKSSEK